MKHAVTNIEELLAQCAPHLSILAEGISKPRMSHLADLRRLLRKATAQADLILAKVQVKSFNAEFPVGSSIRWDGDGRMFLVKHEAGVVLNEDNTVSAMVFLRDSEDGFFGLDLMMGHTFHHTIDKKGATK